MKTQATMVKDDASEAKACLPADDSALASTSSQTSSTSDVTDVPSRGNWGRQLDFMLSCVGYAVGLGNLWRFPYLCMRNGGGAFLIPYFIFMVLCGMPLYFLELSLGQFSSRSPISIWVISPLFKGMGYGMIIVSGIVCIYYNVIMAWSLYYMFVAFTGFKTGELSWAHCNNPWNTPNCLRRSFIPSVNGSADNVTLEEGAWTAANTSTSPLTTALYGNATAVVTAVANQTVANKTMTPSEEFWNYNVLELTDGIGTMGAVRWQVLLCLALAWIIVFLCLFKGVQSSGKVVYVTATAPYLMLLVMLIRGVTLPGAVEGIKYYLTPDFQRLLDYKVWVEACAQIFYSLGPAYGGLLTMASYNKFRNNCYRDAIIIPLINCGTSFFAGFVIFSIIGFLAVNAKLPVDQVITSGPGLAFIVYPEALSLLPLAPLWAVIFFAMLVIIGLDTQFGMFETVTTGICDEFPNLMKGRKTLFTALMCVVQFLLGIPLVTQGGIYIFQIMDWYSATFSLITISAMECLVLSHRYGSTRMYEDIVMMIGYRPSLWWKICWMAITPGVLLIVLIITVVTFSQPTYGSYTYPPWAILLGWGMALCSLVPIPVVMVTKVCRATGPILKRLVRLSAPLEEWGPALPGDRKGTPYAVPDAEAPQKAPLV